MWRSTSLDDAIFYWYHNNKLEKFSCHTDDFIWSDTKNFIKEVTNILKHTFSSDSEECKTFKYLGLCIHQKDGEITIQQVPSINEFKELHK